MHIFQLDIPFGNFWYTFQEILFSKDKINLSIYIPAEFLDLGGKW